MKNESIWLKDKKEFSFPRLTEDKNFDILIIGGGITGLTISYDLKDLGLNIALVEANNLGYGVTLKTTGKITYLQETIYSDLSAKYNRKTAKLYLNSQKEAIKKIVDTIQKENISCDLEKVSSYVIANTIREEKKLKKEKDILEEFGCHVIEEKMKRHYAIAVEDTYVFHPIKYIDGLIDIIKENVSIYEHTTIQKIEHKKGKNICSSERGTITANKVILANHYPFFLIPFFFPLKAKTEKSYILAKKVPFHEEKSFITANYPFTSVRFHKDTENYLLYLGESHNLCNHLNNKENQKRLLKKAKKTLDNPDFYWSNDDILTVDKLPYIGYLKKNDNQLILATGYNTWGMTNSSIAGELIKDLIEDRENPYKNLFAPYRKKTFTYLKETIKILGSNTKSFIENKIIKNKKWYSSNIHFTKKEGQNIAIVYDEKGKHIVYNKCPHMGCGLIYNNVEKTWDCPCHASRFTLDGKCIKGPSCYDISFKK